MTKLKALSVIQCREFVHEQHGSEGIERVKSVMKPASRDVVYSEQLMPTDWVEVEHGVEHARAYDRAFGFGDGSTATEMIYQLTTRHVASLYKSVLTLGTPAHVLERASRLWTRYYDRGESQLEMTGETAAIKRIVGCSDMPRHHEWLIIPYYRALLLQAGVHDIQGKHIRCVALGGHCCETELKWNLVPSNPVLSRRPRP